MYVCTGFPTGVENMRGLFKIQNLRGGGSGGSSQYMGVAWGAGA